MCAALFLDAVRRRMFGGLPWSPSTDESRDEVALHFSTEQLRQLFYSGLAVLAPDGAVLGDVELLVADGGPPSA